MDDRTRRLLLISIITLCGWACFRTNQIVLMLVCFGEMIHISISHMLPLDEEKREKDLKRIDAMPSWLQRCFRFFYVGKPISSVARTIQAIVAIISVNMLVAALIDDHFYKDTFVLTVWSVATVVLIGFYLIARPRKRAGASQEV